MSFDSMVLQFKINYSNFECTYQNMAWKRAAEWWNRTRSIDAMIGPVYLSRSTEEVEILKQFYEKTSKFSD